MNRKAIVFGALGQLGKELVRSLQERDYSVVSFGRSALDISNAAAVEECVRGIGPALVVNAAAYNLVDLAEKETEAAFRTNALAVCNLAIACRGSGSKLVHYSTDYVFDGAKGAPYVETDIPHPLGVYGVSKLAGEFCAFAYSGDALVIRTCGVFGPGGRSTARGNFVETMLRVAHAGKPLRVVSDVVASPTYAPALADRTLDLLERGSCGIINIGGDRPISWYEYAKLIFETAGLRPDLSPSLRSETQTPARRPTYSALSNGKMESLGVAPMPPIEECLSDYFRKARTD